MGRASSSQPQQQPDETPDFGEKLDLKILLALAKLDERDLNEAVLWFDEHASNGWKGALG